MNDSVKYKIAVISFSIAVLCGCVAFSYYFFNQIVSNHSDNNIHQQLRLLLKEIPSAAHARIGFVGTSLYDRTNQLPIYSFNMKYAEDNKGFEKHPVRLNLPLDEFNDIIPVIEDKVCVFEEKSKMTNPAVIARMRYYHINSVIICPVYLNKENFAGVSLLSWDDIQPKPNKENILKDTKLVIQTSENISKILTNTVSQH
jgi:hypothetical protein